MRPDGEGMWEPKGFTLITVVGVRVYLPQPVYVEVRGPRVRSGFCPSTMWVRGFKLRWSVLAPSTFYPLGHLFISVFVFVF